MRREEIIAKGAYTAPQFAELISVKQFIMLRQRGEKYLLLRLCNDRAEKADSYCFRLKQYDVKGNLICSETVTERGISVEGGADFALDRKIKLNKACIDFRIEMVSATYGDYTYNLHGTRLTSVYENKSDEVPVNKQALSKQMEGKNSKVYSNTLKAPKLLLASLALILVAVGIFSGIQLYNFMSTEELFTLDNVEYRFVTDDHFDGPIEIVSYKGHAGNVIIPKEIEGYEVVSIADNAFEGKMLKSITVKGALTVGDMAFANCIYMDTVSMPNVTDIGHSAFLGCYELEDVTLGDSIEEIPPYAFSGCVKLSSIELSAALTSIGDEAFKNCEKLSEIVIPDTVTELGRSVFAGCSSLESLTAPYVGTRVKGLDTINYFFGENSKVPSSLRNIVITKATDIADDAFLSCEGVVSVTLPEGLTSIGENAFAYCAKLKTVNIPETVTNIGIGAFCGCASLEKVSIPDGIGVIREKTFSGCVALTEINVPASVKMLGNEAFLGCKLIEDVPWLENVTSIGDRVFSDCTSLRSATFSLAVTEIPTGTFNGCISLTSVTLSPETLVIDEKAFYGCDKLSTIAMPLSLNTIGKDAFNGCSSLTELNIPDTVRTIGDAAFSGCSALVELSIPTGVTTIGSGVAKGCISLERITLPYIGQTAEDDQALAYLFDNDPVPETVAYVCLTNARRIADSAFINCASIEEIVLNEGITSIGSNAFAHCSSLKALTIPSTVQTIGTYAMSGCSSIEELTIPFVGGDVDDGNDLGYLFDGKWSIPEYLKKVTVTNSTKVKHGAFSDLDQIEEIIYTKDVTEVGSNAFYNCYALKNVELGSYVEIIGSNAFTNCRSIKYLELGDYIKSIGDGSFYNCYGLKSFTIPSLCQYVGYDAFRECRTLYEVYNFSTLTFDEGNDGAGLRNYCLAYRTDDSPVKTIEVNDFKLLLADNGEWYVTDYFGDSTSLVFPSGIEYEDNLIEKYKIPQEAFRERQDISSITIPKDVSEILYNAFWECRKLHEVYNLSDMPIARGSSDYGYVAYYAYVVHNTADAEPLTELAVGDYTFAKSGDKYFLVKYSGLDTDIVLDTFKYDGGDITEYEIVRQAFEEAYTVKSIELTDAVKVIDENAFSNKGSLEKVSFEKNKSLTDIPKYAFSWCENLKLVVLPSSLTNISHDAFYGCSGLREIYNLSSLELSYGSTDHGYVAENAFVIHKSMDEPALREVEIGDSVFLNGGDLWLLEKYNGQKPDIYLDTFEHDGYIIDSYFILSRAFERNNFIERVEIGNAVKGIGVNAFASCYRLNEVSFANNVSIQEIDHYTFAYNRSLDRVVLPKSLISIDYDAFYDCPYLYDVCNLSDMELYIGNYDNGCVALNAKVIRKSLDEVGFEVINVEKSGYTYKFTYDKNSWVLYGFARCDDQYWWYYELPELVVNGAVTPYRVEADMYDCGTAIVPESVTYIDFTRVGFGTVCYKGTRDQFEALAQGFDMSSHIVKYYSDCVHDEDQWTYNENGELVSSMNCYSEGLTVSSCSEKGTVKYTCYYCNKTWVKENDYYEPHSFDENNVCTVCGEGYAAQAFEYVWDVENDEVHPFEFSDTSIVSTSHQDGYTATLKLTAKTSMKLAYNYYTSTENGCDHLIIRKNGVQILSQSGMLEITSGYVLELEVGDVITVSYKKDGGVANGEDCVKLLDIVYLITGN